MGWIGARQRDWQIEGGRGSLAIDFGNISELSERKSHCLCGKRVSSLRNFYSSLMNNLAEIFEILQSGLLSGWANSMGVPYLNHWMMV